MSVNFNRTKTKDCITNKEYDMIRKNWELYCYICVRRAGSYTASCHPSAWNKRGYRYRMHRTWKYNRKTQYK